MNNKKNVFAQLNYHIDSKNKPQILIDAGGIPGNRIDPELTKKIVELCDVRDEKVAPIFSINSFEFLNSPTTVKEFDEESFSREIYEIETELLLKKVTGAVEVETFDHTIRTDGTGIRPPARHVHGDYNDESARERMYDILGKERAAEWEKDRYGLVNIWRPLDYPVERSPLAFADPKFVEITDWTDIDIVYPDRIGHITGLTYNPNHKWLFLPNMSPNEVVVFNAFDSTGRPAVAHSAADLIDLPSTARPRRSIETRSLVRFTRQQTL
jgi:hypothetical protein